MNAELPRLAPAPREVPRGVQLDVLNERGVDSSMVWSIPAAVVLGATAIVRPPTAGRVVLVVIGAMLLFAALRSAVPPLRRALRRLRRMRLGRVTLGRMVSGHVEGDSKRADKPYAEFLGNYVVAVARGQVNWVTGCLLRTFGIMLVVPFGLLVLGAFLALAWRALGLPGVQVSEGLDAAYLAKFTAASVLLFAAAGLYAWWWRSDVARKAQALVEEGRDIEYGDQWKDDFARGLRERAADPNAHIQLLEPLPAASPLIAICTVEYSALGRRQVATTRVPLDARLSLTGMEPLLYETGWPGEVDLLSALPQIEAAQWKPASGARAGASLGFSAFFASVAAGVLLLEVAAIAIGAR